MTDVIAGRIPFMVVDLPVALPQIRDGKVRVLGVTTPSRVADGTGQAADTTITISLDDFQRMWQRELDPTSAYMQGKLRVAGDMGLAMKVDALLQKARG